MAGQPIAVGLGRTPALAQKAIALGYAAYAPIAVEKPQEFKHAEACAGRRGAVAIDPTRILNYDSDKELCRLLGKRSGTAFVLPLSHVLIDSDHRAQSMRRFKRFCGNCALCGARVVLYNDSGDALMLKGPREMIAIMTAVLGMTGTAAKASITEWSAEIA